MKYLSLNNGSKMPALGIGTWQAQEDETEKAMQIALEAGYRHIDTAPSYLTEKAIGRVLRKWITEGQKVPYKVAQKFTQFFTGRVKREDLFIVTKLPSTANRPEDVEATLRKSLTDLQLDYVDVYLIHCPFALWFENGDFRRDENGKILNDLSTDHVAVWKKFEEMVNKGLTKSIGLSNFNQRQLEKLLPSCTIRPANLQIEHHIYLQQRELINFCKNEGIIVTAYSPLGSKGIANLNKAAGVERELPDLMDVPTVKEIAQKHKKSPAQVLLRWIIEHDIVAIPKSTNEERLRQNLNIFDFELSPEEIKKLDALDANIRICDFSFFNGVQSHPEFPFL